MDSIIMTSGDYALAYTLYEKMSIEELVYTLHFRIGGDLQHYRETVNNIAALSRITPSNIYRRLNITTPLKPAFIIIVTLAAYLEIRITELLVCSEEDVAHGKELYGRHVRLSKTPVPREYMKKYLADFNTLSRKELSKKYDLSEKHLADYMHRYQRLLAESEDLESE